MAKASELLKVMQSWVGKNEKDGSHKEIIDIYNSQSKLPRGYKVKYTDPWCATTISALAIKCGATDIIPTECGCGEMIKLLQKMECWIENENRTPNVGDLIFFDWQDSGVGDAKGWADHVGFVESVVNGIITVIEGNFNGEVKRRAIQVNGRYIRGYGVPKYDIEIKVINDIKAPDLSDIKVGDVVSFIGKVHYTSSYAGGVAKPCKAGYATVEDISKGKPHPYLLKAVAGEGSTVHGWVDAKNIAGLKKTTTKEYKEGDVVNFTGNTHYTSSYATGVAKPCKSGQATIEMIVKGRAHPYLLKAVTGKGSTVHGWVNTKDIK